MSKATAHAGRYPQEAGWRQLQHHLGRHDRVHACRTQKSVSTEPVPDKIGEAAMEFAAVVWRIAKELADARLQAARTAIEEARQQMKAERVEAAAFADQLSEEGGRPGRTPGDRRIDSAGTAGRTRPGARSN